VRRCGLKCTRLSIARLPCIATITDTGSAPISCTTQLHTASTAAMESVSVPSYGSCVCRCVATQRDAYHVKEGCVGKEGSSPVYTRMDARFKVGGHGTSDANADDRLHGNLKMQEIRPANSENVVSKRK
jgi:hypothetical protein